MVHSARLATLAPVRLLAGAILCLATVGWLLGAQPTLAESSSQLAGPLLVPDAAPGGIELVGLSHVVALHATEAGTRAQGTQCYTIRNNGEQPAQISLLLLVELATERLELTQDGTAVALSSSSPQAFALTIDDGQSTQLEVAYETAAVPGHLLWWRWDLTPLERWGTVPPVRIVLDYPIHITDEVLWEASSPCDKSSSDAFTWDLASPELVEAFLLAPWTWDEIVRLRGQDDARELAHLYQAIGSDAAALGLNDKAAYAAAIGELTTTLERAPVDAELRSALADTYVARGEAQRDSRLAYLTLAIQQLEAIAPAEQTAAIREQLGQLHVEAALEAEERGDPLLAMDHLQKAETLVGGDLVDQRQETLALRLALSLAEQGRLGQALDALQGRISAQTRDALLRYAPPFASVVTTITMTSEMRVAEQRFQLFDPTADDTLQTLADLTTMLDSRELVEAALDAQKEAALLTVQVTWSDLETLCQVSRELAEALGEEQLVRVVVGSPWRTVPETYVKERSLWQTSIRYKEITDLQYLQILWENEASLAQWQAVEIEAALSPGNEPTFEQRLAHYALSQQLDIWQDMPTSSYWIIRVATDSGSIPQPVGRVAFGKVGQANATSSAYNWGRLMAAGVAALAFVTAMLAMVTGGRRGKQRLH
ncbi:MAG: tetratricopeptide repeat protein [Anaerolineae bacterium]